jgi:hypothetical protein
MIIIATAVNNDGRWNSRVRDVEEPDMPTDLVQGLISTAVVAGTLAIPLIGWVVFSYFTDPEKRATSLAVGTFAAVWLSLAFWLSGAGFFKGSVDKIVPNIAYSVIPLIAAYLAFLFIPEVHKAAVAIPMDWVIGFQFYRVIGGLFLIELARGRVPGLFAIPAGSGDVAIGLSAPIIAYLLHRKWAYAISLAILWNLAGLADLVIAVTMGVLTSPGPFHRLALDSPNVHIGEFPLVLIPVIGVTFSILLHLISLHQIFAGLRVGATTSRSQ